LWASFKQHNGQKKELTKTACDKKTRIIEQKKVETRNHLKKRGETEKPYE